MERDFGSGVLKVTPGHDPTDFEIGQAAGLPALNLLNDDGSLNATAGRFEGLKRTEAQRAVWAALEVGARLPLCAHRPARSGPWRPWTRKAPSLSYQMMASCQAWNRACSS